MISGRATDNYATALTYDDVRHYLADQLEVLAHRPPVCPIISGPFNKPKHTGHELECGNVRIHGPNPNEYVGARDRIADTHPGLRSAFLRMEDGYHAYDAPAKTTIVIRHEGESSFARAGRDCVRTVFWNAREALATPDGLGQPPEAVLRHEVIHLDHEALDPFATAARLLTYHGTMSDREELETVTRENSASASLGQGQLTSYAASPYRVASATSIHPLSGNTAAHTCRTIVMEQLGQNHDNPEIRRYITYTVLGEGWAAHLQRQIERAAAIGRFEESNRLFTGKAFSPVRINRRHAGTAFAMASIHDAALERFRTNLLTKACGHRKLDGRMHQLVAHVLESFGRSRALPREWHEHWAAGISSNTFYQRVLQFAQASPAHDLATAPQEFLDRNRTKIRNDFRMQAPVSAAKYLPGLNVIALPYAAILHGIQRLRISSLEKRLQ